MIFIDFIDFFVLFEFLKDWESFGTNSVGCKLIGTLCILFGEKKMKLTKKRFWSTLYNFW